MPDSADRMLSLENRLLAVEVDIKANTELTKEIRDVIVAAKVGLKVLGAVGIAVKWIGGIAAAIAALYAAFYTITHGGVPPGPK